MLPSLDPILIKGGSMPSRLVCLVLRYKLPDIYIVEKRAKKFKQGPPPFSGNARKKTVLFTRGVP